MAQRLHGRAGWAPALQAGNLLAPPAHSAEPGFCSLGRAGPGCSTPMVAASVMCVLKWQQRRRQSCVARGLLCCTPGQHSVSGGLGPGKAPDSHREPRRAATVEEGEEPPPALHLPVCFWPHWACWLTGWCWETGHLSWGCEGLGTQCLGPVHSFWVNGGPARGPAGWAVAPRLALLAEAVKGHTSAAIGAGGSSHQATWEACQWNEFLPVSGQLSASAPALRPPWATGHHSHRQHAPAC